jgi:hypothetical protein
VHPLLKRVLGVKQAGFPGHIGEGAIAVVAIEAILAVIGEKEILEAVVVVVPNANALRPSDIDQARLDGDIRECAVAVVLVEAIGGAGWGVLKSPAAEDEDVHPSVVVVVEEGAAGCHGLDDIGEAVLLAAYSRLSQAGSLCATSTKREKGGRDFVDPGAALSLPENKEPRTAAGMVRSSSRRVQGPNGLLLMTAAILQKRYCRPG